MKCKLDKTNYLTIKCPECDGFGVVGMSPCRRCGGDPFDPDTTVGSGTIMISVEEFFSFLEQAKKLGLIKENVTKKLILRLLRHFVVEKCITCFLLLESII